MIYCIKGRLYPKDKQLEQLMININCSRFVYNKCLSLKTGIYKKKGINIHKFSMIKYLTYLKKHYPFLKQAESSALQTAVENLYTAFDNFFKKQTNFPQYKKKKSFTGSFTCKNNNNIRIEGNRIRMPKLGFVNVKLPKKKLKELQYNKIQRITVTLKPSGKFLVSVSFLVDDFVHLPKNENKIGIDLGIKSFITDNNGNKYKSVRFLENNLVKLKRLQRKLSRQEMFSSNWKKTKKKIALLHEKIANQRNDFHQKTSSQLINENQVIVSEDLNIKKMYSNKRIARMISDCGWFSFIEMLRYKAKWYGRNFIQVSPFYPSSQLCNNCNYINKEVKNLKVRKWTCPICKAEHDRDVNASLNILHEGLRTLELA